MEFKILKIGDKVIFGKLNYVVCENSTGYFCMPTTKLAQSVFSLYNIDKVYFHRHVLGYTNRTTIFPPCKDLEDLTKFVSHIKKQIKTFVLPDPWHIKITRENQTIISKWAGVKEIPLGHAIGLDPLGKICEKTPDWGKGLTFEQFKTYVLKETSYSSNDHSNKIDFEAIYYQYEQAICSSCKGTNYGEYKYSKCKGEWCDKTRHDFTEKRGLENLPIETDTGTGKTPIISRDNSEDNSIFVFTNPDKSIPEIKKEVFIDTSIINKEIKVINLK